MFNIHFQRLETLLGMIEANDQLVFTDEDLQLLHKSGVIMTDEEAAEMTTNVPSDVPDEVNLWILQNLKFKKFMLILF